MLTIGLVVEALVFAISAFDPPEEELDWSKVYPELEGGTASEKETRCRRIVVSKIRQLIGRSQYRFKLMES